MKYQMGYKQALKNKAINQFYSVKHFFRFMSVRDNDDIWGFVAVLFGVVVMVMGMIMFG